MKYSVIFSLLIFSSLFFLTSNSAFGFCPQNEDWPDRPCYAFPSAVSISSEERWEKWSTYYDYKGGEWMESKGQDQA